jgi:hypothetical protein
MAAYFQRHLALAFLLHPTKLDSPLDSPEVLELVHTYLKSSDHYHVIKTTNHTSLAARLTMLDIAIGPGPLQVPYQPLISPSASPDGLTPKAAPWAASVEEKAFNKEIDTLVKRIKLIGNGIIETGAVTDLSRLEAKGCCERLHHRLESAVRIGGMKLKNPFGIDEEQERGKVMFNRFLGKGKSVDAGEADGL